MTLIIATMLLASPLLVQASDTVCFTYNDAKTILIGLERGKLCEQQVILYEQSEKELAIQMQELKNQIAVLNEKFDATVKQLQIERKIAEEKDKARLQEIEEAGKTKWGQIFGSFGAGALLTIAAVLLL